MTVDVTRCSSDSGSEHDHDHKAPDCSIAVVRQSFEVCRRHRAAGGGPTFWLHVYYMAFKHCITVCCSQTSKREENDISYLFFPDSKVIERQQCDLVIFNRRMFQSVLFCVQSMNHLTLSRVPTKCSILCFCTRILLLQWRCNLATLFVYA